MLIVGALSAALAVVAGAYGAHGLTGATALQVSAYQTAVLLQFLHALGILIIATLALLRPTAKFTAWSGLLMFAGLVLFCGTLYIGALTGYRGLSMLAPVGGTVLVVAWLMLAAGAIRH